MLERNDQMRTFLVSGRREVAGVAPGGVVTEEELGLCSIEALLVGGHIAPQLVKSVKSEKPFPVEEQ
jgi:hypothetical protein